MSNPESNSMGDLLGPEVYRLAQTCRSEAILARAEHLLGAKVIYIERDSIGGSHAVFFVTLENGEQCVVRAATHPEHDLRLQIWVAERCRLLGLPVPETLACDLAPSDSAPPLMISRRMPGIPAYTAPLSPSERRHVFEQLGFYLARIHSITLPGFGTLKSDDTGYRGIFSSLEDYLLDDVARKLGALPDTSLAQERKQAILKRCVLERELVNRPYGVLLHGDYRFKNVLLTEARVTAILDFEMALVGDPAMDIAWLLYSDGNHEPVLNALLTGYAKGTQSPDLWENDSHFRKRVTLYQIRYALEHLWWEASFHNHANVTIVSEQIAVMLASF